MSSPEPPPLSEPPPDAPSSATPRGPRRGRFVAALRIATWLGAIALFGGMALTQTEWGERKIAALAEKAIEEELGLQARLGEVEVRFGWLPPEVFVYAADIELDHPEYGDFVTADALIIRPSLLAFLTGGIDLQTIEIDEPQVHLRIEDGAVVNLPRLPEGGDGPVTLPFDRLIVRDAAVSFDAPPHGSGALRRLDLTVEADGQVMDIALESEEGELQHATGQETLERLLFEGRVDLGERRVEGRRAALRTPLLRVLVRDASFAFDPADGYAGELVTRLDLAQLGRLPIALELPLRGVVELEAQVQGRGDSPSATGTLRLIDVVLDEKWGLGDELDLEFDADRDGVELREGSVAHLRHGGEVALRGRVGLDAEAGYPVELVADIDDLDLGKLMDQLGVTEDAIVRWPMSGRGELRGTLQPFAIEGPLRIRTRDFRVTVEPWHQRRATRILGVDQGVVQGRWRFDEEAAKFLDVRLNTPNSQVHVPVVHLGFDNRLRVEAEATSIDLRDVSPLVDFGLAGVGTATVSVSGTFSSPQVRGAIQVRDFRFDGFPLGDIETNFYLRDDYMAAIFPNLRAAKNTSRYRVDDLTLDFKDERIEVTGHLRASRLTLQDVYHAFHYENDERYAPYQATARGHMTLRYTYDWPGDGPNGTFSTDMDFELLQARLDDIRFDRGAFRGAFVWHDYTRGLDGGELRIDRFELRKGEGALTLSGDIRPPRPGSPANLYLDVEADQLALASLEGVGDRLPIHGIASVLGEVRGTPDVPRMHLDVALTGVRWEDAYLGDARIYVRLTDRTDPWVAEAARWQRVPENEPCAHARRGLARGRWRPAPPVRTVDGPRPRLDRPMAYLVCGEGFGGQVRLDMAVGWTDVYPLRGVVDLIDLRLDSFLESTLPERNFGGKVRGRIALTAGSMLRDGSLGGWIHLDRLELAARNPLEGRDFQLANDGPIDVRLERGGFELRRAVLRGPSDTGLSFSGGGNAEGNLALRVDGTVGLELLESLSPEVADSGGQLSLRVDIGGRVDDPHFSGEAVVRDGRLALRRLAFAQLHDLRGRIEFSERRAVFEGFAARFAGGDLELEGVASIRDGSLRRYGFEVRVRDALLRPMEGVRAGVDARLRLAWRRGERLPLLSGELRLDRVRYERPIQLSPTLGQLYRPQRAEVERYDPDRDNVALDLRVIDLSPIRVRNNLLDLDLRIDDAEQPFRIVGTDQRLGVLGAIEVSRGKVRFRNTEMDVTHGVIRFTDETRLDASFDVLAQTEIRRQQSSRDLTAPTWRVQLRAHGDMDAFRLDATSQPQLSQEDLMLLLTVGMTSVEAQQLQAGDVGGTALEALSAIAGVNEEVTNAVRVIDEFAITTRYSPVTGRPEPMVTIGKRITDRVRLSAATGLTGEQRTFQTGLEWQVGDQTSFQMLYDNINRESSSSFGNLGVDFHWRLEFE